MAIRNATATINPRTQLTLRQPTAVRSPATRAAASVDSFDAGRTVVQNAQTAVTTAAASTPATTSSSGGGFFKTLFAGLLGGLKKLASSLLGTTETAAENGLGTLATRAKDYVSNLIDTGISKVSNWVKNLFGGLLGKLGS